MLMLVGVSLSVNERRKRQRGEEKKCLWLKGTMPAIMTVKSTVFVSTVPSVLILDS